MRLISCYIENFGKLHDETLDFSQGLNAVCKENGWGKSTLCAFIRTMFYGFDGERKHNIIENERKRYTPWQGGAFGGKLVFEKEGKKYEITRVFKDKEINDIFEIRDAETNMLSDHFSSSIGEELFGINRESFLKTVFIDQNQCASSATGDISAKIGNITDNENDINNYERAAQTIKNLKNALTPTKKTGSTKARKEKINELKQELRKGEDIEKSIEDYAEKIRLENDKKQSLIEEVKLNDEIVNKAIERERLSSDIGNYNKLKTAIEDHKNELSELDSFFANGVPTEDEAETMLSEYDKYNSAYAKLSGKEFTTEDEAKLQILSAKFKESIPDEEMLDKVKEKISDYENDKAQIEKNSFSDAEKQEYDHLEPKFANDEKTPREIMDLWGERDNIKKEIDPKRIMITNYKTAAAQNKSSVMPILLVIGFILVAGGVVAALMIHALVGAAVAVAGVIVIVMGIVLGKNNSKNNDTTDEINRLESEISNLENRKLTLENDVKAYLEKHGKQYDEYSVIVNLNSLLEEHMKYTYLADKKEKAESVQDTEKTADLEQSIVDFFNYFGYETTPEKFVETMYTLTGDAGEFKRLAATKNDVDLVQKEYDIEKQKLDNFVAKTAPGYEGELKETLTTICEKTKRVYALRSELERINSELEEFEKNYDVTALDDNDGNDIPSVNEAKQISVELDRQIEEVKQKIDEYKKSYDGLCEAADEIEEKRAECEKLEEIQMVELEKYKLIEIVDQKLAQAKESFTSKYMNPLLTSFKKYYQLLSGADETAMGAYRIDADINITRDELGAQREVVSLSAGYRDMVGIALRAALVDAMYTDEKPMLVMDDPFAMLDDEKIVSARAFLQKLASEYQIIYLTCSEVRA